MIDFNSAFSHDFFQIPIGDAVTHVEEYSVQDHVFRKMVPFEVNRHSWGRSIKLKSPHLLCASQSNQPQN
jgi:hypothetical protein